MSSRFVHGLITDYALVRVTASRQEVKGAIERLEGELKSGEVCIVSCGCGLQRHRGWCADCDSPVVVRETRDVLDFARS